MTQSRKPLPPKLPASDLMSNGKLLSDEEIEAVKKKLKNKDNCRIGKKEGNCQHPVLKSKGRHFALYYGGDNALGTGYVGKVKIAQDLDSGEIYALKIVKEKEIKEAKETSLNFEREYKANEILGRVHSDIITSLTKAGVTQHQMVIDFEQGEELFHGLRKKAQELEAKYGKNTAQVVHAYKRRMLSADVAYKILNDVLGDLETLHKKKMFHRDIKAENIMFDPETGAARLIDMGAAVEIGLDGTSGPISVKGTTPPYFPPEFFKEKEVITTRNIKPGDYESFVTVTEKTEIYTLGYVFKQVADYTSLSLQKLIDKMQSVDPKDRPTLAAVREELDQLYKAHKQNPPLYKVDLQWLFNKKNKEEVVKYFEIISDKPKVEAKEQVTLSEKTVKLTNEGQKAVDKLRISLKNMRRLIEQPVQKLVQKFLEDSKKAIEEAERAKQKNQKAKAEAKEAEDKAKEAKEVAQKTAQEANESKEGPKKAKEASKKAEEASRKAEVKAKKAKDASEEEKKAAENQARFFKQPPELQKQIQIVKHLRSVLIEDKRPAFSEEEINFIREKYPIPIHYIVAVNKLKKLAETQQYEQFSKEEMDALRLLCKEWIGNEANVVATKLPPEFLNAYKGSEEKQSITPRGS